MWRRKQEERGVFFGFFQKKNPKNTPLSKSPFPFGLKERLSYFKKNHSENCWRWKIKLVFYLFYFCHSVLEKQYKKKQDYAGCKNERGGENGNLFHRLIYTEVVSGIEAV